MIEHVLLDLDGVLVQWSEQVCLLFNQPGLIRPTWDVEDWLGISSEEMWAKIDAQGADWWRSLPPYTWNTGLLSLVTSYPFTIATCPSKHVSSVAGKFLWIHDRFGEGFTKFMLGKDKWLMAKPGTVLIDDSDKNCQLFEEAGGHAIVFPQPWNSRRAIADAGLRLAYVRERLTEIKGGGSVKDANWRLRIDSYNDEVLV